MEKNNTKENSVGEIVDKIDLDNGWWYCAKDIGRTLAKTKLTGPQRAIIDFILDETYGWHDSKSDKKEKIKKRKLWAYITFREFEEYTRLGKTRLSENIEKLIEWNIIRRIKNGWKKRYSLNVNVTQWDKEKFRSKFKELVTEKRNQLQGEKVSKDNNDNGFKLKNDKKVTEKRNQLDKLVTEKRKIGYGKAEDGLRKSVTNNRGDTIKSKGLLTPNKSLNRIYVREGEKDHINNNNSLREEEEIIEVFNCWNEHKINPWHTIKPYIQDIRETLKDYSIEEIKLAISNYAYIVKSEYCKFDYQYHLDSFLKAKTIKKFLDLEKAKSNYRDYTFEGNETDSEEYNILKYKPKEDSKTIEEIKTERAKISKMAGIEAKKMKEK